MALRNAIFRSTLVVSYNPDAGETPEDALETYLADNDVSESYEQIGDEPEEGS